MSNYDKMENEKDGRYSKKKQKKTPFFYIWIQNFLIYLIYQFSLQDFIINFF